MELSLTPVIENCHCRGRESVSDAISVITSMWLGLDDCVRTILTTFYNMNHRNYYAATGHVVKFSLS